MTLKPFTRFLRRSALVPRNRLFNRIDPPVVVLLYHRVGTLAADPQMLAVNPDNFRGQLRHLKERYPILRFEDDWSGVSRPSVAITFDDGYADNLHEALPILEEVGVPATVFVTSGYVGSSREFWWDDLERIIGETPALPGNFRLDDPEYGRSWPTGTACERETLMREIHSLMKKLSPERRDGWFAQLRCWATVAETGRATHRSLTQEELRRLGASPWVTIGAHTVTHTPLSSLPPKRQREEIVRSRRDLEGWLGRPVTVFSYPFGGRRDYDRASIRICREAGFARAAANVAGQAHRWTDPLQVPRQLVRNWTVGEFAVRMKEFWLL